MRPGRCDLPTIWRGCSYLPVTLTWFDVDGNPFDLTGWLPHAQSRNFDLGAAIILPATQGLTTISITRDKTAGFRLGVEKWDWLWEDLTNQITYPPVLAGNVEVKEPQTVIIVTG